jgi:hypothetical protein
MVFSDMHFVEQFSWAGRNYLINSSRATRHLLIRDRSASGQVARGGHVTSSGSQPRVCRQPKSSCQILM